MRTKGLWLLLLHLCCTQYVSAQTDTVRVVFRPSKCGQGSNAKRVTDWGIGSYRSGYYYQTRKETKQKYLLEITGRLDTLDYIILYCGDTRTRIEEGYEWFEFREGLHKYYHPNGRIESIGVYNGDKKVGQWRYYDKDGMLIKEEYFAPFDQIIGTSAKFPKL